MYSQTESNTKCCHFTSSGVLQRIKDDFVAAGWTVNKEVSTSVYDIGPNQVAGCLLPHGAPESGYNLSYLATPMFGVGVSTIALINMKEPLLNLLGVSYHAPYSDLYYNSLFSYSSYNFTTSSTVRPYMNNKIFKIYMSPGYTFNSDAASYYYGMNSSSFYSNGNRIAFVEFVSNAITYSSTDLYIRKYGTGTSSAQSIQEVIVLNNPADYIYIKEMITELYVSSTTTSGETIYYSFQYLPEYSVLRCFPSTGFNTNLEVNKQPGAIKILDVETYENFAIPLGSFYQRCHYPNYQFSGDVDSFIIVFTPYYNSFASTTDDSAESFFLSGGVLNKYSSYNGGQYIFTTGVSYRGSNHYILYEDNWYGATLTSSLTNKQGYIDMVTPHNFSTAPTVNKESLLITQLVAGVNLSLVENSNYTPIGVLPNLYKHYGIINKQHVYFKQRVGASVNTFFTMNTSSVKTTKYCFKV